MPLWFGHVIARVRNFAPIEAELILVEIRLEGAQRHGPEAVRILRHLGGRGPLGFVDTALNANKDLPRALAFGAKSRNVTRRSGRTWV